MSPILRSVLNLSSHHGEIQACKRINNPGFLHPKVSRFCSGFRLLKSEPAVQSSLVSLSSFPKNPVSKRIDNHAFLRPMDSRFSSRLSLCEFEPFVQRRSGSICFSTKVEPRNNGKKETRLNWPIFKRWDAPWSWQRACLTMFACASFHYSGSVESLLVQYGSEISEPSVDDHARNLFMKYSICYAVEIGFLYALLAHTFGPLPKDIFRFEFKEPFKLKNGWLLWAGVGFVVDFAAVVLTIAATEYWFSPEREVAQDELIDLIGCSYISTAYCEGIIGILGPLVEEMVFRGFLMVSLTKWFSTPVSVLLSAALFALGHRTPRNFPHLFVGGISLGFSYAKTRNLLTPITMHAIWNSLIVLILYLLNGPLQVGEFVDF